MSTAMYVRIQEFIKGQIASGAWAEGAKMPTEAELGRLFGCSRITVTTALRELAKDGVIERVQGKGTYVARQSRRKGLYDRAGWAGEAFSLASLSLPGEHKCVDVRVELPSPDVAKVLRLGPDQQVIVCTRVKDVDGARFAAERVYFPQALFSPVLEHHLEALHISEISRICGITLGECYVSSEAVICDEAIGALLGVPAGAPVLKFSLEIHDSRMSPVAYEVVFAPGAHARFPIA